MTGRLTGRRAIITGASRGIGAGVAERFEAEGAAVVLVARTVDSHEHLPGSLKETAARCARYGGVVATIAADLGDGEDRNRIVPEAAERLGAPVDILVSGTYRSLDLLAEHAREVMSLDGRTPHRPRQEG